MGFILANLLKAKFRANADDDKWFETDYNENFLKTRSKTHIWKDTTAIFVKKYKLLTHDDKEITQDLLKKATFGIRQKQKKVLQLDLETVLPTLPFWKLIQIVFGFAT